MGDVIVSGEDHKNKKKAAVKMERIWRAMQVCTGNNCQSSPAHKLVLLYIYPLWFLVESFCQFRQQYPANRKAFIKPLQPTKSHIKVFWREEEEVQRK